jgi:hypothetical protein
MGQAILTIWCMAIFVAYAVLEVVHYIKERNGSTTE